MNLLITSDWHVGIRGDSDTYQKIFEDWLPGFLVPTIREQQVDAIAILGDIFDNRNSINVKSMNLALWAIEYLINTFDKLNIYILTGNHDLYFRNQREINSLKIFNKIERVHHINHIETMKFGLRTFTFVPWVVNEEELKLLQSGDVCLGHFAFNDYSMIDGVKETKGFDLKLFTDKFTKVYSGHFHLRNYPYVGNPFQMSWNDTENIKGVTILDTKTLKETFIENKISPIYKKVFLSQLKDKTVSLDVVKNNFVKIYLDCEYTDKLLLTLEKVIQAKKPLSYTFEGLNNDVNLDTEVDSLATPVESLMIWLEKIEMKKGINKEELIKRMNELYMGVIK